MVNMKHLVRTNPDGSWQKNDVPDDFPPGTVPAGAQLLDAAGFAAFVASLPPPTPSAPAGESPEQVYLSKQAEGYLDSPTSLKLKTTESAQQKFTSQVTLLQLALASGQITTSSPVELWDYDDEIHTLPLSDFMGLMLRYGFHCNQLFKDYAP